MLHTLLIVYLISFHPAGCYEDDANKDQRSELSKHPKLVIAVTTNGYTASPQDSQSQDFRLQTPEYAAWMSYTILSLTVFSYLAYLFRRLLARLLTEGLHGITGLAITMEIQRGRDTIQICLGSTYSSQAERQDNRESDIELRQVAVLDATSTSQGSAEVADAFHDCIHTN